MFSIKTTEKFDMIVIFEDRDIDEFDEELIGITELENTLETNNLNLYIKESECSNVVFVECEIDCIEAARQLKNTPSKKISRVVPINIVLKTNFQDIMNKINELSLELIQPGDTFNVDCDVMKIPELTKQHVKNVVREELVNLDLNFDNKNPQWNIYVGVIGENTGISIAKCDDLL